MIFPWSLLPLTCVTSFSYHVKKLNHHGCLSQICKNAKHLSRHTSSLTVTYQDEAQESGNRLKLNTCQFCKQDFESRNALFRHLRGEDDSFCDGFTGASRQGDSPLREREVLQTAVIRYGYFVKDFWDHTNISTNEIDRAGYNEIVANLIHETFVHLAEVFFNGEIGAKLTTSALSYSSAAKLRQPTLRQDDQVRGGVSEVLSFNYRLAFIAGSSLESKWKSYTSNQLLKDMQSSLLHHIQTDLASTNNIEVSQPPLVRLHHIDALVPRSYKFYAERSCSQRIYRYLMPLKWLIIGDRSFINGEDNNDELTYLTEWVRGISESSVASRKHQPRNQTSAVSPECIKRLKQALSAAVSKTIPNRHTRRQELTVTPKQCTNHFSENDKRDVSIHLDSDKIMTSAGSIRLSPGRFGQLWRKERRCWSNFAHTSLRGMAASPSYDACWRVMDRATIVGLLDHSERKENLGVRMDDLQYMHAILEFRGDGFLFGQIPRLISSIVAVTNGWLPRNYFDVAITSDFFVTTPPIAPFSDGRLYFHSPRFHFHELIAKSNENDNVERYNFEKCIKSGLDEEDIWERELQNNLLECARGVNSKVEDDWLLNMRDFVAPSILQNIETISESLIKSNNIGKEAAIVKSSSPVVSGNTPEGVYSSTLQLLRDIAKSCWPTTSSARSRVIMAPSRSSDKIVTTKKGKVATSFSENVLSSGSFTVINEHVWMEKNKSSLPMANALFPELAQSVFELENYIIERNLPPISSADGMERKTSSSNRRPSSTHCAVNWNAQFTPHVDSGRGLGQTLSMIVGLGDYSGGDIMVEGKPYDIRYKPLEFDGWKQLHWTSPFVGERFSLVWFTPALQRDDRYQKQRSNTLPTIEEETCSDEDHRINTLVQVHSSKIRFLPPLKYRSKSTDSLVIREILDPEKGCTYVIGSNKLPNLSHDFTLKSHKKILDVGAHIGVFSRYALGEGCTHIIAYEPECDNFELLSWNLKVVSSELHDSKKTPIIELHSSAVASEQTSTRILVRARNQNDGKENTWRHSLSEYSDYVDRSTKLPSKSQKGMLDRIKVQCVPFFSCRSHDDEKNYGALIPGVTFVKLDCEGAEMEILLSDSASQKSSWLDVTHLVLEWSFTKERRVIVFHNMLQNLRRAGFEVFYEGKGSWWDTDPSVMWPYSNDIIVFAVMSDKNSSFSR